jgi:hypothetical protein
MLWAASPQGVPRDINKMESNEFTEIINLIGKSNKR